MKNPIRCCFWTSAENIEELNEQCHKLEYRRELLMLQIEEGRRNGYVVNDEAGIWLDRSARVIEEARQELEEDGELEGRCCAINFAANKKLNSRTQMVASLNSQSLDIITLPDPEQKKLVSWDDNVLTLAQSSMVSDICNSLMDGGGPSAIGIFGLGGIGKTFVLQKVYQKLLDKSTSCDFDVIIFCTVSAQPNINKIQDEIGIGLGFFDRPWKSKSLNERTKDIHAILSQKKFVLLFDDVWEGFRIRQVGVPLPQENGKKSKMVFTSRSRSLCDSIDAGAVKEFVLKAAEPDEAWELFKKTVGEEILDSSPEITEVAKEIVKRCGGLPLAIVAVARRMRRKNHIDTWNGVLHSLAEESMPESSLSTKKRIHDVLKMSYDHLEDIEKRCFLYSCLLPDHLDKDELVNCFIGKGILDGKESRNQGHEIITKLLSTSLLMAGGSLVMLHDAVREAGLQILWKEKKEKCVVRIGESLTKAPEVGEWQNASGVSLANNDNEKIPILPNFPKLTTLILTKSGLKTIADEFFASMPSLQVLDLSQCEIDKIPISLAGLVGLQYLNLSYTNIRALPSQLKNLVKLRVLILNNMSELEVIPQGMIQGFPCLQVLNVYHCGELDLISTEGDHDLLVGSEEFLDEVEHLEKLNYLGISIKGVKGMKRFAKSRKLQSFTHSLSLMRCKDLTILELPSLEFMLRLRFLEIYNCDDLVKVQIPDQMLSDGCFYSLQYIQIQGCWSLEELTWLSFAPNLETLHIQRCMHLKVIIGEDSSKKADSAESSSNFSRLRHLYLDELPYLSTISHKIVSFPVLEELHVSFCPNLSQLPIDLTSIPETLKWIQGQKEWWDDLLLEDAVKKSLNFKEINY